MSDNTNNMQGQRLSSDIKSGQGWVWEAQKKRRSGSVVRNEIARRSPAPKGGDKEAQLANRKKAIQGVGVTKVGEILDVKYPHMRQALKQ